MKKEDILKRLVELINNKEAIKLTNDSDREELWKKAFVLKKALKWNDEVISLESQYIKSQLINKKVFSIYDIENDDVFSEKVKYSDKIIVWDNDITNIVVDAIAVPASFDIGNNNSKELDEIYYLNGIRLRKKIINIMDGEKLAPDEVLISRSYGIFADYVVHVNYVDDLKKSIINTLECCRVNMIKSLIIRWDFDIKDITSLYDVLIEYIDKYPDVFDKIVINIKTEVKNDLVYHINKEADK